MTQQEILRQVDEVIAKGPYKDTWESLCHYQVPQWYKDAKFGIFIHWGVYSVPAFSSEWYPRNMYQKGSPEYVHHIQTYGNHKDFGYKDFIPMFKAEKFDADEWMKLFKEAGARYVMPVAEHHDGFQMYDSDLSRWNAKQMGPCRDVVGELKAAAEKEGLIFSVSSHRAEHCWFFNFARDIPDADVNDPAYEDFYWKQQDGGHAGGIKISRNVYETPPSKEHCENWLARTCELVDKYRPRIVWFDWWIHNLGFKPYLKKFAAYYYNRAAEWGIEVAINYKYHAYALGSAVYDIERGQLQDISPRLWQNDTAAAKNSWCYTENNDFKDPVDIVGDLVDVVSKNGCLLLNIGPKSDGTITEEDKHILRSVGQWLKLNGEGIYDTTFWEIYGEGPTEVANGAFSDTKRARFTEQDIRFTYKNGVLYAFVMKMPENGMVEIPSLRSNGFENNGGDFNIKEISVLGYDDAYVSFIRSTQGFTARVINPPRTDYPVCLKMILD